MLGSMILTVALFCGYSGFHSYKGEDAPISRELCHAGVLLVVPASLSHYIVAAKLFGLVRVSYAGFAGVTLSSCAYSYQNPNSNAAKLVCSNGVNAFAHIASDRFIEPGVYKALGLVSSAVVARAFTVRGLVRPLVRGVLAGSVMYLSDFHNTHSLAQFELAAKGTIRYFFKSNGQLFGIYAVYRLHSFIGGVSYPAMKALYNNGTVADLPVIVFRGLREVATSFIPLPSDETYSFEWSMFEFSGHLAADSIEPTLKQIAQEMSSGSAQGASEESNHEEETEL